MKIDKGDIRMKSITQKTWTTKKITRKNKLAITSRGKVARTKDFSHYEVALWTGSFWTFKTVKTLSEAKAL